MKVHSLTQVHLDSAKTLEADFLLYRCVCVQKKALEELLKEKEADVTEVVVPKKKKIIDHAENILNSKKKSVKNLKWIPGTSNAAERLFSRASFILGDDRKRLLPVHFERQLFLSYNKKFWDLSTFNDILIPE